MKIIFAADMSFNYFESFPGKEQARATLKEAGELLQSADFSMVNLENIFGDESIGAPIIKGGPNLISEDGFMEYVHALNPTVVGMANNHTNDFGEGAMQHTMDLLREGGYKYIGAGKNLDEAYLPAKLSKDGIDVTIIAICENEYGGATATTAGTAVYNLHRAGKAIINARADGFKPIVFFHGGNEHNPFPAPSKVDLYRHFIDIGAEAVIAMHTHCPQGYEYYEGKPIVYSMGNFFFPKDWKANGMQNIWSLGYMSELDITEDGTKLTIHPYQFDFDRHELLKGEKKERFMKYMKSLCEPIADRAQIEKYFDSWCLTRRWLLDRFEDFNYDEVIADGNPKQAVKFHGPLRCEAHNEVLMNHVEMAYFGRVEEAKKNLTELKKYFMVNLD